MKTTENLCYIIYAEKMKNALLSNAMLCNFFFTSYLRSKRFLSQKCDCIQCLSNTWKMLWLINFVLMRNNFLEDIFKEFCKTNRLRNFCWFNLSRPRRSFCKLMVVCVRRNCLYLCSLEYRSCIQRQTILMMKRLVCNLCSM